MKGLYLKAPHGSLIHEGNKTVIVTPKPCDVEGERVICSREDGVGLAFGIAHISSPELVDVKSFEKLESKHWVSTADRMKWWPGVEELYLYTVTKYEPFPEPIQVDTPPYVRMDMGDVDELLRGKEVRSSDSSIELMSSSSSSELSEPSEPPIPPTQKSTPTHLVNPQDSGIMSIGEVNEMPWTAADAQGHTGKADTPAKQKRWAEVANDALARCQEEGGDSKECEASAIRQANSVIAKAKEKELEDEIAARIATLQAALKGTASDNNLPDSAFLYVEPGDKDEEGKTVPRSKRHLPYQKADGSLDLPRLRNTLSRLGQPSTGGGEDKWLTASLRKRLVTKAQGILRRAKKEIFGDKGLDPIDALGVLAEIELVESEFDTLCVECNEKAGDLGLGAQGKTCTCPNCGFETEGEAGVPCRSQTCPKCGAKLQGGDADEPMDQGEVSAGDDREGNAQEDGDGDGGEDGGNTPQPKPEPEPEPEQEEEPPTVEEPSQTFTEYAVEKLRAVYQALSELFKRETYTAKEPDIMTLYKGHGFKDLGVDSQGWQWFMLWPTNAYRDREEEAFATPALKAYVDRHASDEIKGEAWYWHTPGSKFGTIREQAVVADHFICQLGTYDDTLVGKAFKAFFGKFPDGHPVIAPHGWGASHKYYYDEKDRENGVYNSFDIHESTVLPLHVAANLYNPAPTLGGFKMTDEQKAAFDAIGAEVGVEGFADQVAAIGKAAKDALDARNVERKEIKGEKEPGESVETQGEVPNEDKSTESTPTPAAVAALAKLASSTKEGDSEPEPPETPTAPAPVESGVAQQVIEELQLNELSKVLDGLTTRLKALEEENTMLRSTLSSLTQADEVKQATALQALPRMSWMRATQAAETVIEGDKADAIRAKARGAQVSTAVSGLAAKMGGG